MRSNLIKYLGAILLLLLSVLLYRHFYIDKKHFQTLHPKIEDIQEKIFGIGTLSAKKIYTITPQVSSKLLHLTVDVGDFVKKGELLATLDSIDLPNVLKNKEINLQKATANLHALKSELKSLKVKKNLAYKDLKNYTLLKNKGVYGQSKVDSLSVNYKVFINSIASTKENIKAQELQIKSAKEDIEAIKKKLALYNIYAPSNGYIVAKYANIGEIANPNGAIYKLVNPKDVWIKAYIDERLAGKVSQGERATIKLRSSNKMFNGVVERVELISDPVTLEREVEVTFNKTPIPFYINEQATVNILTQKIMLINFIKIILNIYSFIQINFY
jgi:multidrug efflux pump subunit AcrA (membrane-fusion protein)